MKNKNEHTTFVLEYQDTNKNSTLIASVLSMEQVFIQIEKFLKDVGEKRPYWYYIIPQSNDDHEFIIDYGNNNAFFLVKIVNN